MVAVDTAEQRFVQVARYWAEKLRKKPLDPDMEKVIPAEEVKAYVNYLLKIWDQEPVDQVKVRDLLNAYEFYKCYEFQRQYCTEYIPPACPKVITILRNRDGRVQAEKFSICPVWYKWGYLIPAIKEKAQSPEALARKFGAEKLEELDVETLIKIWRNLKND